MPGGKKHLFLNFLKRSFYALKPPGNPRQHHGTTRDHLVTTWHHQIAWGTTWEPYKAIKLAKTAAFFQCETAKI